MLCEKLECNFINVLKDLKFFRPESDTVEVDRDHNLIEITHKNGNIYSFYLDPVKMNGSENYQLSFINEKGKKSLGIIHSTDDENDIKMGIKKVFS